MEIANGRWRKASDVNREFATFELVLDDVILLDIGFTDSGVLEVAFNTGIANSIVCWDGLLAALNTGRKLAENDR